NNASCTCKGGTTMAYQARILLFRAWDNSTKGKICSGRGINMAMDMNVHVNCRCSQRFGFFVANPLMQFTYSSLKICFLISPLPNKICAPKARTLKIVPTKQTPVQPAYCQPTAPR